MVIKELQQLLANTYSLYLKTQNYHWHVKGQNFKLLHELFEDQYKSLANAVDSIAERILILGGKAPATFKLLSSLSVITDGDSDLPANKMLSDLVADQNKLIISLKTVIVAAQKNNDDGTIAMASEFISKYEKARWFLENHLK